MKKLLLALLGISSGAALACTPGVGNGPSGDPLCMAPILQNDPYYNGSAGYNSYQEPPPPQIQYYEVGYAAIAVNDHTGRLHWVTNANSPQEAEASALAHCKQEDGNDAPCVAVFHTHQEFFSATQGHKDGKTTSFFADGLLSFERSMADCQAAGMSDCEDVVIEGQPRRFL